MSGPGRHSAGSIHFFRRDYRPLPQTDTDVGLDPVSGPFQYLNLSTEHIPLPPPRHWPRSQKRHTCSTDYSARPFTIKAPYRSSPHPGNWRFSLPGNQSLPGCRVVPPPPPGLPLNIHKGWASCTKRKATPPHGLRGMPLDYRADYSGSWP